MASLLVLAPDPDEATALRHGCDRHGLMCHSRQLGPLTCASIPSLDMLLATGGNGKAQFAVHARYLLDHNVDATLLVCVGAAGRLSDSLRIGDVVVATTTIEHDYKERFQPEPLPRHDADPVVLRALRDVAARSEVPVRRPLRSDRKR